MPTDDKAIEAIGQQPVGQANKQSVAMPLRAVLKDSGSN